MRKKKNIQDNGGNRITYYLDTIRKNKKQTKEGQISADAPTKKVKRQKGDYHQSSMEAQINSQTVVLHSDNENQFKKSQRPVQVCYQMLMLGPCDVSYYKRINEQFKKLLDSYSKQQTLKTILKNLEFQHITNLQNLDKIDDEDFWNQTVPRLIEYAIDDKKQKSISACISMLTPNANENQSYRKSQILMIIINMFFCSLPKQSHTKVSLNFGRLMFKSSQQLQTQNSRKIEKLKCMINYLKIMSKRKYRDLEKQNVDVLRATSRFEQKQLSQIQYQMKQVQFQMGLMQDRDKYDIVVDFAHKKIGGGVLNKGAVQEQILFSIYPELLITVCTCYQMGDKQIIVIYNAQRFNRYIGYSDTLKFNGTYQIEKDKQGPFQSTILAVDALNFKSYLNQFQQYTPYYMQRQLTKFVGGLQSAEYKADQNMGVCTGKWGCGVFGGDFYFKFLIQWVACSIANRNMTFMCRQEADLEQLKVMYRFLKKFNSIQVIQIMQQYSKYFQPSKSTQISFIEYLKKYSC